MIVVRMMKEKGFFNVPIPRDSISKRDLVQLFNVFYGTSYRINDFRKIKRKKELRERFDDFDFGYELKDEFGFILVVSNVKD